MTRPYAVEEKTDEGWVVWSTFQNLANAERKRDDLDMIGKEVRTVCSHGCPPNSCLF